MWKHCGPYSRPCRWLPQFAQPCSDGMLRLPMPHYCYHHCPPSIVQIVFYCCLCLPNVVFVLCIAAHNSSMWTYFYFLFLCHMSTSDLYVICTVTSCLEGHLLVILRRVSLVSKHKIKVLAHFGKRTKQI